MSLRIILALIGTWAAITALKAVGRAQTGGLSLAVLGFVIGVFPRVAWQFIQGLTKTIITKLPGMSAALPSLETQLPVSDLDGLTVWHQARLEEEDIENIPNMASADIVDLMISTRFSPDRIIDWVDQAILFTHLGPGKDAVSHREALRREGIWTATSLIQAFMKGQNRPTDAKDVVQLLSAASGSHIWTLVDSMETDPNLDLICNWRGIRRCTWRSPEVNTHDESEVSERASELTLATNS